MWNKNKAHLMVILSFQSVVMRLNLIKSNLHLQNFIIGA